MEIQRVNSVVSGSKVKMFDIAIQQDDGNILSNVIYVADIDRGDNINRTKKSNALSFMSKTDGKEILVHNMYNSKDVFWKSAIYKTSKTARTDTTFDFQDIFQHNLSSHLTNAIEVDNTIYILGQKSDLGHMKISSDILTYISCDNGMVIPDADKIQTVIYNKQYIEDCLDKDISPDPVSAILSSVDSIQYNTIYEIPGQVQNDYQSSNIAANTFKTKNQYDSTYNMSHDKNTFLSNARDYVGIGKCGNQVYLKYYDCMSYDKDTQLPESSQSGKNNFTHQHVEMLGAVNRFANAAGHNTNLYSIAVKTDLLDNLKGNALKTMQYEMQNAIRSIAEALTPAHTQLFKVYVNGD